MHLSTAALCESVAKERNKSLTNTVLFSSNFYFCLFIELQFIHAANEIIFTYAGASDTNHVCGLKEVTFSQAESIACDLAAFSKHAKRKTITVDDVLLTVRKSKPLVCFSLAFPPVLYHCLE